MTNLYDSALEEDGFEPSVPSQDDDVFKATLFPSIAPPAPPERPTRSREGPVVRIPLPPAASQPLLSPRVKGKSGENCDCRPHRSVGWARSCPDPAHTPTRIRGTVDKLNGQNLMVKSRDGQTLTIELIANVAGITWLRASLAKRRKGAARCSKLPQYRLRRAHPASPARCTRWSPACRGF
jgi:hypothetical protein